MQVAEAKCRSRSREVEGSRSKSRLMTYGSRERRYARPYCFQLLDFSSSRLLGFSPPRSATGLLGPSTARPLDPTLRARKQIRGARLNLRRNVERAREAFEDCL